MILHAKNIFSDNNNCWLLEFDKYMVEMCIAHIIASCAKYTHP